MCDVSQITRTAIKEEEIEKNGKLQNSKTSSGYK